MKRVLIAGLHKADVLLALYDGARYQGNCVYFDVSTIMAQPGLYRAGSKEKALAYFKSAQAKKDYKFVEVNLGFPKTICVDLDGFDFDPTEYDNLHGYHGYADSLIKVLRSEYAHDKSVAPLLASLSQAFLEMSDEEFDSSERETEEEREVLIEEVVAEEFKEASDEEFELESIEDMSDEIDEEILEINNKEYKKPKEDLDYIIAVGGLKEFIDRNLTTRNELAQIYETQPWVIDILRRSAGIQWVLDKVFTIPQLCSLTHEHENMIKSGQRRNIEEVKNYLLQIQRDKTKLTEPQLDQPRFFAEKSKDKGKGPADFELALLEEGRLQF